MNHDDRLIVALDFHTMEQAKAVVLELGDSRKVGMQSFIMQGSETDAPIKGIIGQN